MPFFRFINFDRPAADRSRVRAMRARLMMKIVSLLVMLVVTVFTAHSCSGGSSHSSPLDPSNLARNGLTGLCANQQAEQAAAGDPSGQASLQVPASDSALARVAGLSGGSLSCPPVTAAAGGS